MEGAKQILKFFLVLSALFAIGWWINEYSINPYSESVTYYSRRHQIVWLAGTLLMASGITHVVFYFLIANTAMFRTIRLSLILLLTTGTSTLSAAQLVGWRVMEYIQSTNRIWLVYYPLISLATVLLRYFWLRNKGRLDLAATSESTAKPNRP